LTARSGEGEARGCLLLGTPAQQTRAAAELFASSISTTDIVTTLKSFSRGVRVDGFATAIA
jgi:hypothetical protein